MSKECDEWFAKLEEKVNDRLAELHPTKSTATAATGVQTYNKCIGKIEDEDYNDKIGTFDKLRREMRFQWTATEMGQRYETLQNENSNRDTEGDAAQKCKSKQYQEYLKDDNIALWVNEAISEIGTDTRRQLPEGCDENAATARSSAEQEDLQEEVERLQRECAKAAQRGEDSPPACAELQRALDALTQQADQTRALNLQALSERQNVNFKEQCFLLGEIYGIARRKEELDEFIDPSDLTPPFGPKSAWREELKPLPYPNGINKEGKNASLTVQGDPF